MRARLFILLGRGLLLGVGFFALRLLQRWLIERTPWRSFDAAVQTQAALVIGLELLSWLVLSFVVLEVLRFGWHRFRQRNPSQPSSRSKDVTQQEAKAEQPRKEFL